MIERMIVDADLCIKLGGSDKYRYLYEILPLVAERVYMHAHAKSEVLMPSSAVKQLSDLVSEGKLEIVSENDLSQNDKAIFYATYKKLARVMIDSHRPNKNKGEVCSLAYAKAVGIPIFATDEANLQPIIDAQLNTGIDDITCIRIVDIVRKARDGEINIPRKICKALWLVAGKKKEIFDSEIWPTAQSEAKELIDKIRQASANCPDMTLEEINEEIAAARAERELNKK